MLAPALALFWILILTALWIWIDVASIKKEDQRSRRRHGFDE